MARNWVLVPRISTKTAGVVTAPTSPVVTSATFTISNPEITNPDGGAFVGQMQATGGPTVWSLSGVGSQYFNISSTGVITIGTQNANLFAPVIGNFNFNVIHSNLGVGSVIGTLTATNSPTQWQIITGNTSNFFAINNLGVLSVALVPSVNTYTLGIEVSNTFGANIGTAIVNVLPGVPVVSGGPFSFTTPIAQGVTVGTMSATNGPITNWQIISGDPAGDFAIAGSGATAGRITTAQAISASINSETLTVQATNSSGNGTNNVTISWTGVPVISGGPFSFDTPISQGAFIGQMTATNGPITNWAITAGDPAGDFAIAGTGATAGQITAAQAISGTSSETLTIQATNATGSSTSSVAITWSATFNNAETTALAAAISPPAPQAWLTSADNLITALKSAGVWTTLDLFYCLAAPTAQAASLNWRAPTTAAQTLGTNGTITFSANQYAQGDGSTGFLSTSFAMNSGLATNGNACVGYFCLNDDTGTASPIATSTATSRSGIGIASGTTALNNATCSLNSSTSLSASSQWGSSVGHWTVQQTSTTNLQVYLDGSEITSGSVTNSADNGNIQLMKASGAFSAKQLAFAHVGQQLTAAAQLGFSKALYNFLASSAIGVRPKVANPVIPTTGGPQNVGPYKHVALGTGNSLVVPETTSSTALTGLVQGGRSGGAYPYCLIRVNDPNYLNIWRLEVHPGDTAPFDTTDLRIQLRTQQSLSYPASNDICFAVLIENGTGLGTSFCDINDYHDTSSGVNTGPTHGLVTFGSGFGIYVWIYPNETSITNLSSPTNPPAAAQFAANTWYMVRTAWTEGASGTVQTWVGPLPSGPFTQIVNYTGAVGNSASPTGNWQQMALYRDPANNNNTCVWYANFEFDSSGTFPFAARLTSPLPVPPINQ